MTGKLNKDNYRELKKNILIEESFEQMVEISTEFLRFNPHPYEKLNAPYKNRSPFYVREGVLKQLLKAQVKLNSIKNGYKLKIFDAYRPIEVQKFMIDYDKNRVSQEKYDSLFVNLKEIEKNDVECIVSHFWSPISKNIDLNPPPHSTGGALDLTIVDDNGVELDMGSNIDELIDESASDFFIDTESIYDNNRELLVEVMSFAEFIQLPTEWWHFSYGDQIWAASFKKEKRVNAKYGMI